MGCFLGCFGSSKDVKKRPKTPYFPSKHNPNQYNPIYPTENSTVIEIEDAVEKPSNLVYETGEKQKEEQKLSLCSKEKQEEEQKVGLSSKDKFDESLQLSSGKRKKVTFDTNVKEYEHVLFDDSQKVLQESEKKVDKDVVVECSIKPSKSSSESEGSALSSLGLFPPNHRYQDCGESDDDDDELECEVSDLDEEEEEEDEGCDDESNDDVFNQREVHEVSARSCSSVESRTKSYDGYYDQVMHHGSLDKGTTTPVKFNRGARDRGGYVHSVMNPIENTAQWKTVKVKGAPPMTKEQKENFLGDLGFQNSSTKPNSKLDKVDKNNHDVAVDASLSTWLASSLKTPQSKGIPPNWGPILSGSSVSSKGSNSVRSHEERPSLGALTVEEMNHFSATPSSRRSPSQSPDERPIVGSVGVHWKDTTPVDKPASVSSFKGIPNSNTKYREDQRVNWHSTPFETRLERALNRCAAECADDTQRSC